MLAGYLHNVDVVRRWGAHFCPVFLRHNRRITFRSPLQQGDAFSTFVAPTSPEHVLHAEVAPHWDPKSRFKISMADSNRAEPCRLRINKLVLRFSPTTSVVDAPVNQPSDDEIAAAMEELLRSLAFTLLTHRTVTLVQPEAWFPVGYYYSRWQWWTTKESWVSHIVRTFPRDFPTERLFGMDVTTLVQEKFELLSEEEYRARVGPEVYALEEYCKPWTPCAE
jgi:hypothetical protein